MRKGNREKRERKRVDYSKKAREIRKGLHWRENGRSTDDKTTEQDHHYQRQG